MANVDGDIFEAYIRDDLCPLLGNYKEGAPNSVVAMDNASIHNGSEIRTLC